MFERLRPLAVVSIALLVGCQQAAPTSVAPTGAPATAAATPAATKLTVAQAAAIDTLDPVVTTRNEGFSVVVNIHEGLVQRNPKTMQPDPALAVSWSQPDTKTWLFKLRTGVKFHNGEAFDSTVAKYNFDRVIDPDLKSSSGATLMPILDKVEAVDPTTLRITTKQPSVWLLERLMTIRFVPQKETSEKGKEHVASNPVGTGPYRFVEWRRGQSVALTRNEDYWGTKPAFKDVVFREIQESGTALSELIAGNVDIAALVPLDQIDFVNRSGRATVQAVPTQGILEVPLDAIARTKPGPWTDKRVRQAMNYAVNKEAILKNLLPPSSQLVPSIFNPLVFGYDPTIKPYPYDAAKAKQLLAEAGYANGFEFELKIYPLAGGYVDSRVLGQAIIADLEKVGIKGSIKQVSSADISPVIRGGTAGPGYLRANECASSYDAALCFAFYTKGSIFAYYNSDKIEELRLKGESTSDPNERKRIYSEIQKFMYDEAPTIFGWSGTALVGVSTKVDYTPQSDNYTRLFLAKPK